MWIALSIFLAFSLCFSWTEDRLKSLIGDAVRERFGDSVRVERIKILDWKGGLEGTPKVELDMEYGRARALAYLDFGQKRLSAILEVYWKAKFLVAKQDIPKGTVLSEELFAEEERWLRSIPNDFRLNKEELEKYQTSTYIPRGSILRRSIIKPLPAVKRGDVVKLILRSGNLEITTYGTALDGGEVGKTVRVKTQAGKTMRGKIVDTGTVELFE
ncbi:flagellar basal body P-ring formation chaperone FlgA [Thermocrinis sp.]|uniref:flagellar basal body P-ring formation chaperone FlgA n=1 Tax=Thermocrinis sp. TaxID=2024383 RepID=UPI002FDEE2CC